MKILINYLTNEYVQKGCLLEASDWILTPYRTLFNGRDVEIWIDGKNVRTDDVIDLSLTRSKKLAYIVIAVAASPLALIAVLFKWILSPSLNLKPSNPEITTLRWVIPLVIEETV